MEHGGDWAGFLDEYGEMPLDFSANISPVSPPAGVREAAEKALAHMERYPDPQCRALRRSLSGKLRVPEEWILCGNGASDLIWRLVEALRPKRALLPAPTFMEYQAALEHWGCLIENYPLSEQDDFRLGAGIISAIMPETDIVILCQPGNPTGSVMDEVVLTEIMKRCRQCDTLLAVDECFLDFLEESEQATLLPHLLDGNVILFRAFTKTYGMAGLRLGYCLSAETELLDAMTRGTQPWPVSAPAQAAGEAALRDDGYIGILRILIRTQRPILEEGLTNAGCRVIPGRANFLLFYHPDTELDKKLREKGILIRACRDYTGLGEGWYRISVRREEENQKLLQEINEVLHG